MRARKTATTLRREQIITAALELIAAEGVYALSMGGIARRVGIVPSALYRHFDSKDEVLDAVLDSIQRRLLDNVSRVRRDTPGALERLRRILMRHARMLSETRTIPHIVFSDGIYTGHPERKAKVAGVITGFLGSIEAIIAEGQADGTIRGDVAPATAAVMFIGMVLPAAVLWNVTEGTFDMSAHAASAWPAFKRCIAAYPSDLVPSGAAPGPAT